MATNFSSHLTPSHYQKCIEALSTLTICKDVLKISNDDESKRSVISRPFNIQPFMAATPIDDTMLSSADERDINLARALPHKRLEDDPKGMFSLLHGDDSDSARLCSCGPSLGIQQRGLSLLMARHAAVDCPMSTDDNDLSKFLYNIFVCYNKNSAPFSLRKDICLLVENADLHAQAYIMLVISRSLLESPNLLKEIRKLASENVSNPSVSKVLHRILFGVIGRFEAGPGIDKWNRSRHFSACHLINVLLHCGNWVVELGRDSQHHVSDGAKQVGAEILTNALVESNSSCGEVEEQMNETLINKRAAKNDLLKMRKELEELSRPDVAVDTFVQENKITLSFNIERLEERIKSLDGEYETAAKTHQIVVYTQEEILESLVKLADNDKKSAAVIVQALTTLKRLTGLMGSKSNRIKVACALLIGSPQISNPMTNNILFNLYFLFIINLESPHRKSSRCVE
jgi:hypothetical protein